jgi:hypothetical protein
MRAGYEAEMEAQMEGDGSDYKAKHSCLHELTEVFCPCCVYRSEVKAAPQTKVVCPKGEKDKDPEASGKLLEVFASNHPPPSQPHPHPHHQHPHDLSDAHAHVHAGAIYRSRPSPSAPVLDPEHDPMMVYQSDLIRQYSQPVQATT